MAVNLYEAMFVVEASRGGSRLPDTVRHIAGMLQRHGAEIERIEKWDERRFAYPIKHVKRGIYILTYFRLDGSQVAPLRETIRLSEDVLRVLIVRPDEVKPPKGELYSPEGELLERPAEQAEGEPGGATEEGEQQESSAEVVQTEMSEQ